MGTVQKSLMPIADISDGFITKITDFKDTLSQVGEYLVLFEIDFYKATVTLDFENIEVITLIN